MRTPATHARWHATRASDERRVMTMIDGRSDGEATTTSAATTREDALSARGRRPESAARERSDTIIIRVLNTSRARVGARATKIVFFVARSLLAALAKSKPSRLRLVVGKKTFRNGKLRRPLP